MLGFAQLFHGRFGNAVADDPRRSAADALRSALGDATLRVAYPTPDGTWRDRHGHVIVLPGREVTMITDSGESVAALIHGSSPRIDPAAVTEAAAAARLLLDTERLEAGALARVNDGPTWSATCMTVHSSVW